MSKIYHNETGYLELLSDTLNKGVIVPSERTGTSTIALFDAKLVYDEDVFPFSTVTSAPLRLAFEEFWFFLKGRTQTKELEEKGINFWKGNTSREFLDSRGLEWLPEGSMGAGYGFQFRNYNGIVTDRIQPLPKLRDGLVATSLGIANGDGASRHKKLYTVWRNMLHRCYVEDDKDYHNYGGKGVYVSNDWLEFSQFLADAKTLPNWNDTCEGIQLDKDMLGDGYCYSKNTCIWLTAIENQHQKAKHITTVQRVADGERFSFTVARKFCDDHGIPHNNFSDLWSKEKNPNGTKIRNGFVFVSRKKIAKGIDQLKETYETLKTDKYSRRVYTTFWNPNESHLMALTPCWHSHQFVVLPDNEGNKVLHLKLINRSLDILFGCRFAVQQYRLYQMCLAKMLGFKVGKLSCDLTHVHIYENQIEYIKETLERDYHKETYPLDSVKINKEINDLEDLLSLQWSDIIVEEIAVNTTKYKTPRPEMVA